MTVRDLSQRVRVAAVRVLTLVSAALLLPALLFAQSPNQVPYFAIQNARLVTVSGDVIENGTIVLANGLIEAIGTDVAIPPEAWVIDGAGLTVYPGLIDSLTNLGLQAGEGAGATPTQPRERRRPRISRGPEDRPATTPWENAADKLNTSDKRLENWRKAGFTAVVTSPDKGAFPGQAALINLAGRRPRDMVVKTPVALRVTLTPPGNFRSFPGSLMGALAYIRQVFLDAEHYGQAWQTYEAAPRGLERPTYDRTLDPIYRAVQERRPVLIPATWAKEIHRALALGEAARANTLIYGAHQGYELAGALAAKNVPVVVSLKWPEKPKDADPDADVPLRVLRFRRRAPSTPAALHKAGAKFAFYSDGIGNPKDIFKKTRQAIEAGLPAEAALRAFTLSAAEIFGVSDRLGSLEEGKIANLTVTDGELFGEKTKVKMVFIDGRKYEAREPGRPTEPPAVNLTGTWTLAVNTPQGTQDRTARLTMDEDGTLSGSLTGRRGTSDLTSGWVSGKKFSFTISVTMGPRTLEITYTGTAEGNQMTGTVSAGPMSADFTGTRPEDKSRTAGWN